MSGHSKWKQIKRQKAVTDSQRAKIFTKMGRILAVAARKGADPEMNSELRMAIERAKYENMPKDNIERAIKKGAGGEGENLESVEYEAFGPHGVLFIIKVLTDNKNRTAGEVKNVLSRNSGRFGEIGTVKWMFDKLGLITVESSDKSRNEEIELEAISAGAEDVKEKDGILEIYTAPESLDKTRVALEGKRIKISGASIDWIPKTPLAIDNDKAKEQVEPLMDALDELDDVEEIYSNMENL